MHVRQCQAAGAGRAPAAAGKTAVKHCQGWQHAARPLHAITACRSACGHAATHAHAGLEPNPWALACIPGAVSVGQHLLPHQADAAPPAAAQRQEVACGGGVKRVVDTWQRRQRQLKGV